MAHYTYEPLSSQDAFFLHTETPRNQMHVAGTALCEAGSLALPDGGFDIETFRAQVDSRLHLVPRFRQRLMFTPVFGNPVWIDDERFNLTYHVRHTSLPRPGTERDLKRLVGRISSQHLDRGKPLWEIWVVEGLADGRIAIVNKTHHCMIDGMAGVDLTAMLMSLTPELSTELGPTYIPRPAPTPGKLLRDELMRRAAQPLSVLTDLPGTLRELRELPQRTWWALEGIAEFAGATFPFADATPLNRPIGPHRRVDWTELDLAKVKDVKNRLGGTVNDVICTVATGAVRRYLEQRRFSVYGLDFRAMVPVSVRGEDEHGTLGNRVSSWVFPLPVEERDPTVVFRQVHQTTEELKRSHQAVGAELLTQASDWGGSTLLSLGVRLAARMRPFNLTITNVPGPQVPLYLAGCKMLGAYPQVPLVGNQALGLALMSYAGKLCWGLNADWDAVPDLHEFCRAIQTAFAELYDAAQAVEVRTKRKGPRSPRRTRKTTATTRASRA